MKSLIMMASLLFSIIACGQTKPKDMDDKKQIEQLYKQMYQAMIAKDIATLNTILADGSVLIHMTGTYGGGRHTWRLQMKSKLAKTNGRWQFVESKASTY